MGALVATESARSITEVGAVASTCIGPGRGAAGHASTCVTVGVHRRHRGHRRCRVFTGTRELGLATLQRIPGITRRNLNLRIFYLWASIGPAFP